MHSANNLKQSKIVRKESRAKNQLNSYKTLKDSVRIICKFMSEDGFLRLCCEARTCLFFLVGVVSPLSTIAPVNDLGHPLCANLRNGHWLMDYIASRLKNYPGTKQLGDCMEQLFAPLKDIPRFLVPSYFNLIIMQVYKDLMNQAWSQMSE